MSRGFCGRQRIPRTSCTVSERIVHKRRSDELATKGSSFEDTPVRESEALSTIFPDNLGACWKRLIKTSLLQLNEPEGNNELWISGFSPLRVFVLQPVPSVREDRLL